MRVSVFNTVYTQRAVEADHILPSETPFVTPGMLEIFDVRPICVVIRDADPVLHTIRPFIS